MFEIAMGHLFTMEVAFLINVLYGLTILTLPYFVGLWRGEELIEQVVDRYPRFIKLLAKQENNAFFLCFFLRIIGGVPKWCVTAYLGATKVNFFQNLLGGLIGMLPRIILATIFGGSMRDVHSAAFWISAILMLVMTILSLLLYLLYQRYQSEGKKEEMKNDEG